MLHLSRQVNGLKERVEAESLYSRKSSMWRAASTIDEFPKMTEEQLRALTCGSYMYKLQLSRCYIQEHLDGNHDILVHREEPQLLKVKMQSRHVSSKATKLRYGVNCLFVSKVIRITKSFKNY